MLIAIAVLVISSFMLVSVYARGWIPAVNAMGSWLLAIPIVWGIVAIAFTILAPPWLVMTWIAAAWVAPIAMFLIDAAIKHPIDLVISLPPTMAHVWAIVTIMQAVTA